MAVRVRPATTREGNAPAVVRVVDDRCLVFDPKVEAEPFYFQGQKCGGLKKDARDATFIFDKVIRHPCCRKKRVGFREDRFSLRTFVSEVWATDFDRFCVCPSMEAN